jgi:hypothetical protein
MANSYSNKSLLAIGILKRQETQEIGKIRSIKARNQQFFIN